jgi:hypothetical protein
VIQYRLPNPGCTTAEAATCEHAALADLRRHGPWVVQVEEGMLVLTQRVDGWQAAGWGEWQDAVIAGRKFRVATNLPSLSLLRRPRLRNLGALSVELACGESIRIPPAIADGASFGFDGAPRRLASAYGQAVVALLDRSARGEEPTVAEWLSAIRLAIQAGHRLTDDAIHARDLISSTDLEGYLGAMTTGPKAEPASGG